MDRKFFGAMILLILLCFISMTPVTGDAPSDYWNPWMTMTNTTSIPATLSQQYGDSNEVVKIVKYAHESYYNHTPADYWDPWVTKTNTTSATINWWQKSESGRWIVRYANESYYTKYGNLDRTLTEPGSANYHHVLLTGLDPDTTYRYRVEPETGAGVFSVRKFQTFPVNGSFSFIVMSDSHSNENRFRYVGDAVNNEKDVLFVLHGGDYSDFDNASIITPFFQYGNGMLANYTIFTNIGNHEYYNSTSLFGRPSDTYEYRNAFAYPLDYSFDCAGVRFIILASPDPNSAHNSSDPPASFNYSQSQAPWLKDQLDNTLQGTFVIDHHPVWATSKVSPNPALQPWETLFQQYPISADFAGHVHNYERFSVQGVPYFVVGNSGGRFDNLSDSRPYASTFVYGETRHLGYLKVTVNPQNNTATAKEYFVASVPEDSSQTATIISPPYLADSVTFPLRANASPARLPIQDGGSKEGKESISTSPQITRSLGEPAASPGGIPFLMEGLAVAAGIAIVIAAGYILRNRKLQR